MSDFRPHGPDVARVGDLWLARLCVERDRGVAEEIVARPIAAEPNRRAICLCRIT